MPRIESRRGSGQRRAAVAVAACALFLLCSASASAAGANWLDPIDLSQEGRDASNAVVAMDAAGNTVAIWERQSPVDVSHNLQIATRAPGGAFTAPVEFALNGTAPQLAMTPAGEAVAVWKHFQSPPDVYTIQVATRPPGGAFSAPTTVPTTPSTVIPGDVRVAVGPGGDVVVTWKETDPNSVFTDFPELHCGFAPLPPFGPSPCPNPSFVMASVRPAGGAFTEAQQISPPLSEPPEEEPALEEWAIVESKKAAGHGRPAMDAAGNATVVFTYFDGEDSVIESVERPAGGEFSAPTQLSEAGADSGLGEIGVDAAGNAIASWLRSEAPTSVVRAAVKPPGGGFGAPVDVSTPAEVAEGPVLRVAPSGMATIAWKRTKPTGVLRASSRPPGGPFSAPIDLSNGKDSPQFYDLAVSDQGDAIVVWSGDNAQNTKIVRAAVRPAGAAAFGPRVAISKSSADTFQPVPSMDATGDATVVWTRDKGLNTIVQMAGYDADPPLLGGVSVPAIGHVADPLPFSAQSSDFWPVGAPRFDFGDGAGASGAAVTHAYSTPGTYSVTISATDAGGRTTSTVRSLLVKARNFFKIRRLRRNRRKGTAALVIFVPEPGTVTVNGKWIKKARARTATAGAVKLPIRAIGKGLKRLQKKGRLRVRLRIVYAPVGGDTRVKHRRVVLRKERRHGGQPKAR
jgi:PKD domain